MIWLQRLKVLCWVLSVFASAGAAFCAVYPIVRPSKDPPHPPAIVPPALSAGNIPEPGFNRYEAIASRWKKPVKPVEVAPAQPARPPLVLERTVVDPERSLARIRHEVVKKSQWYRAGERIQPGEMDLIEVFVDKVVVRYNKQEFTLTREETAAPAAPAGAAGTLPHTAPSGAIPVPVPQAAASGPAGDFSYEVTTDKFREYVGDIDKVYLQGSYRVIPGKGLHIKHLDAGALARQYGLQPQDIVKTINGKEVANLGTLAELMGQLKSSPEAFKRTELVVERQGQSFTIVCNVR
jgi:type II secretory pathway component PulC